MSEGIEQAAAAFDAVINDRPPSRASNKAPSADDGPREAIFRNVGELDRDTEPKGGGDDNPEELIYGDQNKSTKSGARDPRKTNKEDREGDDDGSDGDDASGAEHDPADDDAEPDPDDTADDEEAEDQEPGEAALLQRKVEVTVDGQPVEVSLKEALEGYVRTETFHRRMNQLDEAKKIVRRAAADAVHNYEYSIRLAKEMEAHMNTMIPQEPDWDQEFAKDPQRARELQRYYEKANAFRGELRKQTVELAKQQADTNQKQLAAFAEEEIGKFESMNRKNWSDPKRKTKDLESMRRTALSEGFSEQEVSQVYDSRMLSILLKASKYDRMMANKPKPVIRQPTKPIPPGAGSAKQRTARKGVSSAMNRLNRTGSIEDAALVMDQIIARG